MTEKLLLPPAIHPIPGRAWQLGCSTLPGLRSRSDWPAPKRKHCTRCGEPGRSLPSPNHRPGKALRSSPCGRQSRASARLLLRQEHEIAAARFVTGIQLPLCTRFLLQPPGHHQQGSSPDPQRLHHSGQCVSGVFVSPGCCMVARYTVRRYRRLRLGHRRPLQRQPSPLIFPPIGPVASGCGIPALSK